MELPARLVELDGYVKDTIRREGYAYWFKATSRRWRNRQYCVRQTTRGAWWGYKIWPYKEAVTLPQKMTDKLVAMAMLSKHWRG